MSFFDNLFKKVDAVLKDGKLSNHVTANLDHAVSQGQLVSEAINKKTIEELKKGTSK